MGYVFEGQDVQRGDEGVTEVKGRIHSVHDVCEGAGEDVPGGQSSQVSAVVAPDVVEAVPGGQGVQGEELAAGE